MLILEVGAEQLPFQLRWEPFDVCEVTNDGGISWIEDNKVSRIARLMPKDWKELVLDYFFW